MIRKIILGKTYLTSFNTEFTPVEHVPGKYKANRSMGNPNAVNQREESRFLDADGNRIRKSKLKTLKTDE
jgi:hypothetical protein